MTNSHNVHDGLEVQADQTAMRVRGDITALAKATEDWRNSDMPVTEYLKMLAARKAKP